MGEEDLSQSALRRLESYVRQLSAKFLLAQAYEREERELRVAESVASSLMNDFSLAREPEGTIRLCLARLSEMYKSKKSVLFLVSGEAREYSLVASHNFVVDKTSSAAFPIPRFPTIDSLFHGLVQQCIITQSPCNSSESTIETEVSEIAQIFSNNKGRDTAVRAMPIKFANKIVGVAVFEVSAESLSEHVVHRIESRVRRICAVALERTHQQRRGDQLQRQLSSLEGLMLSMQQFDADNVAQDTLARLCDRNRLTLDVLMRFICEYFDSEHAVLYTPDHAIEWSAAKPEDFVSSLSKVSLQFRSSYGQDPTQIRDTQRETFSAFDNSLRSAVVRSLRVLTSENVLTAPRRSGQFDELLRDKHKSVSGQASCWSWIGFPVLSRNSSCTSFYGIVCAMRKRQSELDSRTFAERDVRSAEQIGCLIGNGINHSTSVARYAAGVRKVFQYFGHQVRGPLTTAVSLLQSIRARVDSIDHDESEKLTEEIELLTRFASAAVAAYLDFYSGSERWEAGSVEYPLIQLVEDILSVLKRKLEGIEVEITGLEDICMFNIDRNRLCVIVYTLLENAITACHENCNCEKRIVINGILQDDMIVLSICDSGLGLPLGVAEEDLFKIENSFFKRPSTGIGLAMVKDFICCLPGGDVKITDNIKKPGASATIKIPLKIPKSIA